MKNEPEFFLIQSLTFDPELQIRVKASEETIASYAEQMGTLEEMKKFPPIEVYYDGTKYWLADGHHRRAAAEMAGHDSVWAIIKSGTRSDALWAAIRGNGKQGLALTRADKQRAIILAVTQWPDRSSLMIAETVGCGETTIRRYREQHPTSPNGEVENQRRVGKDGKSRPAKLKSTKKTTTEKLEVTPLQEDAISPEETPAPEVSTLFSDETPGFKPGSPEEEKYSSKTQLKPIPRNRPDILVSNLISFFPQEFVPNTAREVFRQLFERYGKEVTKPLAAEIYAKYGKK